MSFYSSFKKVIIDLLFNNKFVYYLQKNELLYFNKVLLNK